ncbi:probable 3-alpha-(or 20-beta)-hydroxysteroid dehydrogenase [Rhynchosporium agropyri]|uniref:Probable 3-alpha-(Or 20-beta)-hydroxysteroid dehydrogenase n=3 Tax=Rhynchosporium TaxID=38037 RepID=A0A1E1M2B8_RHYSE|nr:probable 3-alpha-(or 20-beta)-hydroxysteroid dehydrogenase [Rhynchosporium agropyri]CZS96755.1 probable 3-alpha-(or 20-beta)-hydroxysteroid dehydrogenase [Rhynchosporium commune]CZT43247.1 probable 3-alpha-(or 20-beta)-hydroxysteroid dehydrogenase [Rhynchosporium secalis]
MFSRSAFRATRTLRVAPPAFRAVRPITVSARQSEPVPEVVAATEVKHSSYVDGSVEHSTIVVDQSAVDKTGPLSKAVYNNLPKTMQNMSLMDKIVVVTGAARGLGYSMAQACAEAGAKAIIILDANQQLGEEAVASLHSLTGDTVPVAFYNVDVRDENAINESINALVKAYGVPHVLINSAGIADSNMPAETYDTKKWTRLIDINLTGSFLMAQAVGKHMIDAKQAGSIIFIASMSGGIVNYPQEQSCYNASKAGVIQLGKSLAAEWAKYNIRVNCISPGYMDTALNNVPALDAQKKIWKSLTPQNRLGAVHDLNGLAVLLASDASAFMTGSNVIIDGGYTLY